MMGCGSPWWRQWMCRHRYLIHSAPFVFTQANRTLAVLAPRIWGEAATEKSPVLCVALHAGAPKLLLGQSPSNWDETCPKTERHPE